MSDYLFDKEGEPDADIARLERVLAPLAYRGVAPRLPERGARRRYVVVAAALSAVAAIIVALVVAHPWRPAAPSWAATVRDGVASRDGHALTGATQLPVGAWLDSQEAHVRLLVADLGSVELAPHSRARIVATGPTRHQLELARGALVAAIDAPARRFVVATPRAVVTDLGCAFELAVDEAGRGRLVVTGGRVAVAAGGGPEVVVPAGARVDLSERGASAPYVAAAPAAPTAPTPSTATAPAAPNAPTAPIAPAPPSASTPPSTRATPPPHRAKPPRHAPHTPAAAPPHAAHKALPPSSPHDRAQPPRKSDTAPAIHHDALKELERSGE